jgi:saccharopine dehydrogenase (NAD+, L-lysine-forming)
MTIKILVIRREYKLNEYRVPIIPVDCIKLLKNNFTVYVEKSVDRCFKDEFYKNYGCTIIDDYTKYNFIKEETLIIGLKELDYNNKKILSYKHLYFSHTYKNQINNREILSRFKQEKGIIYDLEYLVDDKNKRLIAFGFWAGFIGTAISLLQFYYKSINKELVNLVPLDDYKIFIDELKNYEDNYKSIEIGIIGINGRCGQGCKYLLDKLDIKYIGYIRSDVLDSLINHDIIINCIKLEKDTELTIISDKNLGDFKKLSIINDVSCDITAVNNPIKLNYQLTTFNNPIYKYNKQLDIICIDNLPSLLPIDSSTEFSNKLIELILTINDDKIWENLENLYYYKIEHI